MENNIILFLSYFNLVLLVLKGIVFVAAEFVFYPKAMKKINFLDRIKATLFSIDREADIFADELEKLKVHKLLWRLIFILLILRIVISISMSFFA